jgi:hypothetical protein
MLGEGVILSQDRLGIKIKGYVNIDYRDAPRDGDGLGGTVEFGFLYGGARVAFVETDGEF